MSLRAATEIFVDFTYIRNYLKLALIEWELIPVSPERGIVFIGGGPLPLSAIIFALLEKARAEGLLEEFRAGIVQEKFDKNATRDIIFSILSGSASTPFRLLLVDHQDESSQRAGEIVKRLALSDSIATQSVPGQLMQLPQGFDSVCIASMAEPKKEIIRNFLRQTRGKITIAVRSVQRDSLKELLYTPYSQNEFAGLAEEFPGFKEMRSFTPPPGSELINSVHVFEYGRAGTEP